MTLLRADLDVSDFSAAVNLYGGGPTPRFYGEALVEAARADPRIVCLGGDLSGATETDLFRDTFRERFFNIGIAEANMIGVAAGMARSGDIPFVHSFSVFVTRRCYDQIAMQVAYPRTNVKIVGFMPGLTTLLGVSHQAIDDIALMRALPNIMVIEPSDPSEVGAAVHAAVEHQGPVYLRMRRIETSWRPAETADFAPGRGKLLRDGSDGVIFAIGHMVSIAMEAAERLAEEGRQIAVAALPTIKPLDADFAVDLARRCGAVVTAENHSIIGGLGSAVAETLMENGVRAGFQRVGVRDQFAEGGSTPYLFEKYGLSVEAVIAAMKRAQRGS